MKREDGRSEISLESSVNAMEEKPECSGKRTEQLGLDNNFSEIASLSQRPEDGENPHKKHLTKHLKRSSSRKQKERTLINDEFTEFSQFGSRFMLNQPEEKNKKTNFVEHLQENKIFNKVATTVLNTCQKHYKKRTTPPDQQNTYRQRTKHSETNIPIALPRSKKPDDRKMVKPKEISSSNENFLSVQGELCKSLSIPSVNSTGKTLKYPNGLNGSSTKSDTDSGISGDTYVGDIRIKQVCLGYFFLL